MAVRNKAKPAKAKTKAKSKSASKKVVKLKSKKAAAKTASNGNGLPRPSSKPYGAMGAMRLSKRCMLSQRGVVPGLGRLSSISHLIRRSPQDVASWSSGHRLRGSARSSSMSGPALCRLAPASVGRRVPLKQEWLSASCQRAREGE